MHASVYHKSSVKKAYRLTMFCETLGVHPIKAGTSAGEDFDAGGEERDQFQVPSSHFAAGFPKRPHYGLEVSPCFLLKVPGEGGAGKVFGGRVDDSELREESFVNVTVVSDWIAEVEDDGLFGGSHAGLVDGELYLVLKVDGPVIGFGPLQT